MRSLQVFGVLALLQFMAPAATASALGASAWVDRTFRVSGTWNGEAIETESVQLRESVDDPHRVQVIARLRTLDVGRRSFVLGPFRVKWTDETRFERLSIDALGKTPAVRVSGRVRDGVLTAKSIRAAEDPGARRVQLTGTVTSAVELDDGVIELGIAGLPVQSRRAGYNAVESLVRRQDSRRPVSGPTWRLFGRPLSFGGEYETTVRDRRNYELAEAADQTIDMSADVQLEALYTITDSVHVFVGGKFSYEADLLRDGGRREPTSVGSRDQTWIFFDRIAGSGFGLQIGRQNFKEAREWWWDDDLDAVRVYYDRAGFHGEVGLARELAPVDFEGPIDPAQEDVTRVLGTLGWLWAPRQKVELYFLHASDSSARGQVGDSLDESREDDSDATLTWFGARAIGSRPLPRFGQIDYWADFAQVSGSEDVIDYDTVGTTSVVQSVSHRDVRGTGFDLGVTWETRLPGEPSITLSFARGSGDADDADDTDGAFRQTGLHANKWRFGGVNRFRFYGEVLRPELSNLSIATVSAGLPLLRNSSLELSWHRYRQVVASDSMRDVRIDADPSGDDPDIGSELDLVLGFREGRSVDLALTVGVFEPGRAFDGVAQRRAWLGAIEFTWNF